MKFSLLRFDEGMTVQRQPFFFLEHRSSRKVRVLFIPVGELFLRGGPIARSIIPQTCLSLSNKHFRKPENRTIITIVYIYISYTRYQCRETLIVR